MRQPHVPQEGEDSTTKMPFANPTSFHSILSAALSRHSSFGPEGELLQKETEQTCKMINFPGQMLVCVSASY